MDEPIKMVKMQVKKVRVDTFMETLACQCGGALVFTGHSLPPNQEGQPQFVHQCPKCQAQAVVIDKFPRLQYEETKIVRPV